MQKIQPKPASTTSLLRQLPSVDRLLHLPQVVDLVACYSLPLVTDALREALAETRANLAAGHLDTIPPDVSFAQMAEEIISDQLSPSLRPVINATGVIIHTNLGRAPLSTDALAAIEMVSAGYSTLEYDLEEGRRGSRTVHAEKYLTRLTGAEAALVVNNNAAAVLLMLTALGRGREVITSRGQLVEIGGGFRIPDVLAQSGAHLVEVGTTNRTHLRDYAQAITENTAAILVTHYSNYKIIGFTSQPEMADLAALAREHNLLLLFDQGSGMLLDVAPFGLEPETTVIDGLRAGCDVVAFSGDKMLGGPQAGILCGRRDLISQLKQHPLARAIRADKLCLAGLTATLSHYLRDEATDKIPVWQMIARPIAAIEAEAQAWSDRLREAGIESQIIAGESRIGGGSLPGTSLPTHMIAIAPGHINVDGLAVALRAAPVPVIGRIQDGHLLLDPRTVLPEQVDALIDGVIASFHTQA